MIEESQCEFKTYKLAKTGKNALDFYIAVESGILGVHAFCSTRNQQRRIYQSIYEISHSKSIDIIYVLDN